MKKTDVEIINDLYNEYIKESLINKDRAINNLVANDDLKKIVSKRMNRYHLNDVNQAVFDFIFSLYLLFDKYDSNKLSLIVYFNTNLRYYILSELSKEKNDFGGSKNQNIRILKSIVNNPENYNLSEKEIIKIFKEKTNIKKDSKAIEYLSLLNNNTPHFEESNYVVSNDYTYGFSVNDDFINLLKEDNSELNGLTDYECEIFIKRFIDNVKGVELAKEYNVSKQYISKVLAKGKKILRSRINRDNISKYINKG